MVRAQAALGRGDPLLRRGRLTTPTHLRASVREGQTGNGERRAALRFSWRPGGKGRAPDGLRQKAGADKHRNMQTPEHANTGTDKSGARETRKPTNAEHANTGTCKRREHANAGTDKSGARETRKPTNAEHANTGTDKRRNRQERSTRNPGACKRREHAGIAAPAKNRGKKLAVRPFFVSLFTEQTNKKFFSL